MDIRKWTRRSSLMMNHKYLTPKGYENGISLTEAILFFLRTFSIVWNVWNVTAHMQKPDFVFRRKGRVHLNWWGCQFSRLLAAELCASALVILDTPCSEAVWEYWLPTPFASFPFTSPPMCHRVPPGFKCTLLHFRQWFCFHLQVREST
jgi:hypothetical protein